MIKELYLYAKKLILSERTPTKLAAASATGVFISFSPFIGIHWLMTIIVAWFFRLNVAVIYFAAHVVNNPLTMVPVYLADYAVGVFITRTLFGVDLTPYNPTWMKWLNTHLACLQIPNISLWDFIIGGNVLGIICGLISYPLLVRFFDRTISVVRQEKGS